MTVVGATGAAEVRGFEPGDVVRVRSESWTSVVLPSVLPVRRRHRLLWWLNHKRPDRVPDLPSMWGFPLVLVRTLTPADYENGVLRWVEVRDLTLWHPD